MVFREGAAAEERGGAAARGGVGAPGVGAQARGGARSGWSHEGADSVGLVAEAGEESQVELVAGGALDLASSPRVSCSRKWSQKIGVKLVKV